jgi:hypothetical protein
MKIFAIFFLTKSGLYIMKTGTMDEFPTHARQTRLENALSLRHGLGRQQQRLSNLE